MGCSKLSQVSIHLGPSNYNYISSYAFYGLSSLQSVYISGISSYLYIGSYAFQNCYSLSTVIIGGLSETSSNYVNFVSYAFYSYRRLLSLYLLTKSMCYLNNNNVFQYTPISNYSVYTSSFGTIYVPQSLLTSYQTNWSVYSSRFVGLTDEEIEAILNN